MLRHLFFILVSFTATMSSTAANENSQGAWHFTTHIISECKDALKYSEKEHDLFYQTACHAFISGFYQGLSAGGLSMFMNAQRFTTREEHQEMIDNYNKDYPICFPEDFNQLDKDFTFRDLTKSFITAYEQDEDISGHSHSLYSFFSFLRKYNNCNTPK